MKSRLWVIEWQYSNGEWDVCDSSLGIKSSGTNFYEVHKNKRAIQKELQNHYNEAWHKNRFRVTEYISRY